MLRGGDPSSCDMYVCMDEVPRALQGLAGLVMLDVWMYGIYERENEKPQFSLCIYDLARVHTYCFFLGLKS